MASEYRWVVTRETRRWKTIFGNRRSESVTLIPALRNARRRTRTRWGRTVTEEWRLVDRDTGGVLDGPGQHVRAEPAPHIRSQTYKATLKFPDGQERECCDAGHDSVEGARSHAEQIAAELGYDANETRKNPPA
jgi:hypothetical protein